MIFNIQNHLIIQIVKKKHSKIHSNSDIKLSSNQDDENQTAIINPDFTYKIYSQNISCFYRGQNLNGRHHLQLEAASILPILFVTSVVINKKERKNLEFIDLNLRKINYGSVALGQSSDALVTLRNMSRHNYTLIFYYTIGSFEVLTPVTTISSSQSADIKIRFSPCTLR